MTPPAEKIVRVDATDAPLDGTLVEGERGIVVFAHGSGSSRHSPRNRYVARVLNDAGFGTLLLDLLTLEEDREYATRFDIDLLAARVRAAVAYARDTRERIGVGLFGASTGAAAALVAAADDPNVSAVVSRGGRPDLALDALQRVSAAVLLIVGGADRDVLQLNRTALGSMKPPARLQVVPGATHLFEEPGALERVAEHARDWFSLHLR